MKRDAALFPFQLVTALHLCSVAAHLWTGGKTIGQLLIVLGREGVASLQCLSLLGEVIGDRTGLGASNFFVALFGCLFELGASNFVVALFGCLFKLGASNFVVALFGCLFDRINAAFDSRHLECRSTGREEF